VTDRQRDRQTERQTDRGRQAGRQAGRQTETDRQTDTQTQTDRQADRDRQTDSEANKQTNKPFQKASSSKENITLVKKERNFMLQGLFEKFVIAASVKKSRASLDQVVHNSPIATIFLRTNVSSTCSLPLKFTSRLRTYFSYCLCSLKVPLILTSWIYSPEQHLTAACPKTSEMLNCTDNLCDIF
jgi:hypothetical protein